MCATYLGNLADLRTGRSQGNRMVSININKCCGSCSSFSLLNFPARAACKAGQSENFCASDGQNKRNPRPIRPVVHALWRCPCLRLLCFFYSFFSMELRVANTALACSCFSRNQQLLLLLLVLGSDGSSFSSLSSSSCYSFCFRIAIVKLLRQLCNT